MTADEWSTVVDVIITITWKPTADLGTEDKLLTPLLPAVPSTGRPQQPRRTGTARAWCAAPRLSCQPRAAPREWLGL